MWRNNDIIFALNLKIILKGSLVYYLTQLIVLCYELTVIFKKRISSPIVYSKINDYDSNYNSIIISVNKRLHKLEY